jgi:sialidase-1
VSAFLLAGVGAVCAAGASEPSEPEGESPFLAPEDVVVWKGGHRIPAVLYTAEGTLLAFAEQRHASADHGNVDLVLKRSADGGRTWSEPLLVHESGSKASGNPCPVQDRETGTIWLLFSRDNNTQAMVTHSRDDGLTWAEAEPLGKPDPAHNRHSTPTKWIALGPCHGIQLASGRLLAPANVSRSFCYTSDDHGKTWKYSNIVADTYANECCAVELADGSVYLSMRTPEGRGDYHRTWVVSKDGGTTWPLRADGPEKQLPGPACQMSVIRLTDEKRHDRNRILFSGPAPANRREDLTIRISYDECKTWQTCRVIKEGGASYSDLVVFPDMTIGCLYETNTGAWQRIRFARFTLEWLTRGKDRIDAGKFK